MTAMTAYPNEAQVEEYSADMDTLARLLVPELAPLLQQMARLLEPGRPVVVLPSDDWTPTTYQLGGGTGPVQIVGPDISRLRLTIVNVSTETAYLSPDANNLRNGLDLAIPTPNVFPLVAGASLTLETRAGIAAVAGTADTTVAVISETRNRA